MDRFFEGSNKKTIGKYAALLLAVAFLFAVIFSVYFVASEVHHDCSGEECPVCIFIHQCEANITQMDGTVPVVALPLLILFIGLLISLSSGFVFSRTLISEKIRLNN